MNRVSFPRDTRRTPIFGLGCVAGAAGVARAADWVRAYPDAVAVLVSVELCSLTLRSGDVSVANLIASGLFGDGAAAVVVAGPGRASGHPRVLDSCSVFYPDSERVMGWDMSERGFGIVLDASVPDVVRRHIGADVDRFLARHRLQRRDIDRWICHPGGPKVLEAMSDALGLDNGALDLTWRSLREVGNLSSTSVLLVLRDAIEEDRPTGDGYALMLAMGPGFCSELVLLEW
jgi:alkylresorcinol/alkylpyrone synthase